MVNYDISKVFGALPEIIKGLPMTLLVILLTTLLGSLLGGLVAWVRDMFLSYAVPHRLCCYF